MNNVKKSLAVLLSLVVCLVGMLPVTSLQAKADELKTTISFVDTTPEGWVANDCAVIELVDNTNGGRYIMTKVNSKTWTVEVPKAAYNITFNRYNYNCSTLWNSWSAGGRNAKVNYNVDSASNGSWIEVSRDSYKAGDVVFLDLTSFPNWKYNYPTLYINFTSATKLENGGGDVTVTRSNSQLYSPINELSQVGNNVYKYVVTQRSEGAKTLRFWRGDYSTLWNCSVQLTYADFASGKHTVKVTDWSEAGYTY